MSATTKSKINLETSTLHYSYRRRGALPIDKTVPVIPFEPQYDALVRLANKIGITMCRYEGRLHPDGTAGDSYYQNNTIFVGDGERIDAVAHEIAHYLLASPLRRRYYNYKLHINDDRGENDEEVRTCRVGFYIMKRLGVPRKDIASTAIEYGFGQAYHNAERESLATIFKIARADLAQKVNLKGFFPKV